MTTHDDRPVGAAYARFLSAYERFLDGDSDAGGEMLAAMHDALSAYCNPSNHPDGEPPREAFPPEIAHHVAMLLQDLSGNDGNPILDGLKRSGRRGYGYGGSLAQTTAAQYCWAAKKGLIDDSHPNKTVRECFDVDKSTVRRWCKSPLPPLSATLLKMPAGDRAALMGLLLRKAAEHYQHVGRSVGLTVRRDHKRKGAQ